MLTISIVVVECATALEDADAARTPPSSPRPSF
jgi:hypothetical protein